jgi:hypothetical protein
MSDEPRTCEMNAIDQRPAQFVFKHTDGSEHYICHVHVDEYARKHPDAVKSDIAS